MPRFVIAPSSPRPSTSIQGSQGSGSLLKRMTGLGLGLGLRLAMGLALEPKGPWTSGMVRVTAWVGTACRLAKCQ